MVHEARFQLYLVAKEISDVINPIKYHRGSVKKHEKNKDIKGNILFIQKGHGTSSQMVI